MSECKTKKYLVHYHETYSGKYEIEANNEKEAEKFLKEMIQNGKAEGPVECENSWCEISELYGTSTYKVDITETYKRTVSVSATDEDDAYNKVEEMINDGKIDLPCDGGEYDYGRDLFVKSPKCV